MAISTYNELQAAVASWINRSDLTASIPDFIRLGEAMIRRDIRARDQLTNYTATLTSEEVALPDDLVEIRRVKASVNGYPKTLEYVAEDVYDTQPNASVPTFFTVDGNTLKVRGGSTAVLNYWAAYDALEDTATNWLLTNSPDVYLFAALIEAHDFVSDTDGVLKYAERYKRAATEFNNNEKLALVGGPMRVRTA